jgi:Skp family chaperone for outer membrane proteins
VLNTLERIWKHIRYKYIQQRLYKYGTCGLKYFDDRSLVEKVADKIDDLFFQRQQNIRNGRSNVKQVWHTFYSHSLGRFVDSAEVIRKQEKKGYAWAKASEFEEVANKAQKRIDQESKDRIRKKVEYAASQIKQGRSYIKEQRERREKYLRANGH